MEDNIKETLFSGKEYACCEDITLVFKTGEQLDTEGNIISTTEKTLVIKEFNLDEYCKEEDDLKNQPSSYFVKRGIFHALDRQIGGTLTSSEFEKMRPKLKMKIGDAVFGALLSFEDTKMELIKKK